MAQIIHIAVYLDGKVDTAATLPEILDALKEQQGNVVDQVIEYFDAVDELNDSVVNGTYEKNDAFCKSLILKSLTRARRDGEEHAYYALNIGWTNRREATRFLPVSTEKFFAEQEALSPKEEYVWLFDR